ncbi:hypothetical protein [Microbacterium rhizomatis]|uniref:Uncharacterized protein n=1 Tax=Microbacterium rhizomatis TaxID=1631477 RepID=A0A5J5IY21_9MICO|nr:hypothetical protein [Microbacterium rhizomatis]KAA9106346.1 hypothetical protein F6B43_14400 [Microbacterium rhizomatis]
MVTVALLCAGCTPEASTQRREAGQPLSSSAPVPSTPPSLLVNNAPIDLASYDWVIDGKKENFRVSAQENDATLQEVALEQNVPVVMTIRPGRMPDQLIVSAFDELDDRGIPTSSTGKEFDCNRGQCDVTSVSSAMLTFSVTLPPETRVFATHVGYFDATGLGSGREPVLLSASWGVRVAHD